MEKSTILRRFLTGLPARFEVAAGPVQMDAVIVDVDETSRLPVSGRARARLIERLRLHLEP